jgi:pyruvate kinase
MLSGETAVGKFPVETVLTMKSIILETEHDFDYRAFFEQHSNYILHDVPSAVTLAAVKTSYTSNAKAIFAFTTGGSTARLLSRFHPEMPIIAMTPDKKCYHQLAALWGTVPFYCREPHTMEQAFEKITEYTLENNFVSYGDLVVVTAGSPFGISGTTNMMLVESIGDVLVRGFSGYGRRLYGNVALVMSPDARKPYAIRGQILVLAECNPSYLPLMKESAAIILQNHIDDKDSEKYALDMARELEKSVVVRADAALHILKEGQLVTLDPEKSLVYKGVVF